MDLTEAVIDVLLAGITIMAAVSLLVGAVFVVRRIVSGAESESPGHGATGA